MKRRHLALGAAFVLGVVAGLSAPRPLRATEYRLETVVDNDILTILNQFSSQITTLKASVSTVTVAVDGLAAKLDADGGVTDVNYDATFGNPCATVATTISALATAHTARK